MSGLNRNGKGFIIFPQPKHSAKLLPPPYDETPRISRARPLPAQMGLLLMLLCRGVQGAALVLCLESRRSRSGSLSDLPRIHSLVRSSPHRLKLHELPLNEGRLILRIKDLLANLLWRTVYPTTASRRYGTMPCLLSNSQKPQQQTLPSTCSPMSPSLAVPLQARRFRVAGRVLPSSARRVGKGVSFQVREPRQHSLWPTPPPLLRRYDEAKQAKQAKQAFSLASALASDTAACKDRSRAQRKGVHGASSRLELLEIRGPQLLKRRAQKREPEPAARVFLPAPGGWLRSSPPSPEQSDKRQLGRRQNGLFLAEVHRAAAGPRAPCASPVGGPPKVFQGAGRGRAAGAAQTCRSSFRWSKTSPSTPGPPCKAKNTLAPY